MESSCNSSQSGRKRGRLGPQEALLLQPPRKKPNLKQQRPSRNSSFTNVAVAELPKGNDNQIGRQRDIVCIQEELPNLNQQRPSRNSSFTNVAELTPGNDSQIERKRGSIGSQEELPNLTQQRPSRNPSLTSVAELASGCDNRSERGSIGTSGYNSIGTQLSLQKLKHRHRFYGDAVCGILLLVMTPFLVYKMHAERNSSGLDDFDAAVMVGTTAFAGLFQWSAWKRDNLICSRMGFLLGVFVGWHMEYKEWPFRGVCTITPRFQSGIVLLSLANVSLTFREKIIRCIVLFVVGSYVSIQSPYSVYTEDALPHLGGSVLATILVLYVLENKIVTFPSVKKEEFIVQSARLMLVAIYVYHLCKAFKIILVHEAGAEQLMEAVYLMIQTSFVAIVATAATGVFKIDADQKEQLKILVGETTKDLYRINIAFEACDTAIAITDASRTVIWTNPAFETLSKKTRDMRHHRFTDSILNTLTSDADVSSIGQQLTDAIALDSYANETKLRGAFDFSSPRQDEILIHGGKKGKYSAASEYRVEVTPYADRDESGDTPSFNDESVEETMTIFEAATAGTGRRGSFPANSNTQFLVAFHDITSDRARERAEQLAREEALVSKAMKESMVTLTHELRTPLQGIMGITSVMLEQPEFQPGAKQLPSSSVRKDNSDSLGLIMASSSLLLNLINNLLDVKKASANMMDEFLLSPLKVSDPIRDAINFCKPLAFISNVDIDIHCCGDATESHVNANGLRLQQVLINMISNAIKYTDNGTTIRVSTRSSTVGEVTMALRESIACSDWKDQASSMPPESTPLLVISVSDSGPGIDRNDAWRLFQRFARLNQQPTRTLGKSTVGQPSGTGLGLHLCQMFVKRMRGWTWAENNVDRGSTFSFCLHLIRSPESPPQKPSFVSHSIVTSGPQVLHSPQSKNEPLRRGHRSPSSDYRNLRVLVVDDILINRKVLDRLLKKIGVTCALSVESGRDALHELFSTGNNYDLVITDLQMPGMSGIELTQEIFRKWGTLEQREPPEGLLTPRPSIVVVGLTADTTPGMAKKCSESGMSDLLYKPITLSEIKDYFQTKVGNFRPGQWCRQKDRFVDHNCTLDMIHGGGHCSNHAHNVD